MVITMYELSILLQALSSFASAATVKWRRIEHQHVRYKEESQKAYFMGTD